MFNLIFIIARKIRHKYTLSEWNLESLCNSHIMMFISYRISCWFYFMTLEDLTLLLRKVTVNIKIAFILCYEYNHIDNDDKDHIIRHLWIIISLVLLRSKLQLKMKERIHDLRKIYFLNTYKWMTVENAKLHDKECMIFKLILTHSVYHKNKAQCEILQVSYIPLHWFNDYCMPRKKFHSIWIPQMF